MRGRYDEARDILNKISVSNKIQLPDKIMSEEKKQLIRNEEVSYLHLYVSCSSFSQTY